MKHDLSLLVTYLSGPMDLDLGGGKEWREVITKELIKIGFLKENIYSPTNKPIENNIDLNEERKMVNELRSKGAWKKLEAFILEVMHTDLRMTDIASIVIVHLTRQDVLCECSNCKIIQANWKKLPKEFNFEEKSFNREDVKTVGTWHELICARQSKKPVLVIHEDGIKNLSAWLIGLVGRENIFSSIKECIDYLKDVRDGKVEVDEKRWLFFSQNKK